jgi:hypothetical protein
MKPWDLAVELQQIVARTCGCVAVWDDKRDVTYNEYVAIEYKLQTLIAEKRIEAFDRELDARLRLKERGL